MRRMGIAAEAGFTLIEVLAASMVLLTGVLGAAELTNVANKSTNVSSARNGATSVARRVVEAAGGLLRTGSERVILRRPAAEVEADLGAIRDGKAEDPALSPGDEVVVKARRL